MCTITVAVMCIVITKGISIVERYAHLHAIKQERFTGTKVRTNLTILVATAVPLFGGTASCLDTRLLGPRVLMSLTVTVVPLFGGTASGVAMIRYTKR